MDHVKRREKRRSIHHYNRHEEASAHAPNEPPASEIGLQQRRGTLRSMADSLVTAADVVNRVIQYRLPHRREHRRRQLPRKRYGRLEIKKPLGQFLYNAFKLFEVMDNYRDRQLMNGYLLGDPPLHSRRTLDQAYYWTLRSTNTRDRDQVVYRSTSARPDELHHYDPEDKMWDCPQREFRAVQSQDIASLEAPPTRSRSLRDHVANGSDRLIQNLSPISQTSQDILHRVSSQFRASQYSCSGQDIEMATPDAPEPSVNTLNTAGHGHGHRDEPQVSHHQECLGCREAIQKLPRLIMVDQLWMWILDEDTVITCFPRRYGVNRKDASGIHKAIRTRLGSPGGTKIHSACDLALIIIDECGKVFFDRTKTDERQPQVIDIFSEAIGRMVKVYYSLWVIDSNMDILGPKTDAIL